MSVDIEYDEITKELKKLKIILLNTHAKLNTIKENIDSVGVKQEQTYTKLIKNIENKIFELETKKEELYEKILHRDEYIDKLDETRQKNNFESLDENKCYEYSVKNGPYKYIGKFIEYEFFKDGFIFYFEKKTFGVPKDSIEKVKFKEIDMCFEETEETEETRRNRERFHFLENGQCYEYSVQNGPYKYLGKFLNFKSIEEYRQFNFEKKN